MICSQLEAAANCVAGVLGSTIAQLHSAQFGLLHAAHFVKLAVRFEAAVNVVAGAMVAQLH